MKDHDTKLLSLQEWDEATNEQRNKWLDEGRVVSLEDAIKLKNRYIRK